MAQLSVNETTTFRWSFEEDVAHYAAAGIPSIGIWRHKLSDYGHQRGLELLSQTGLAVSHLFWAGGFTGSDGRSYRASVEDAHEALRTAAALGAGCLIVHSGARAGHTYNHAKRLIRDALKELAPAAAEHGVALAVEPMHPGCAGQFTFLTSLDDVLELFERVDSPQVKMVFDTYHLGHDPSIVERISGIVDRIALVQLGDARHPPEGDQDRCRLGEGVLPLVEIVSALKDAGYDGFYDVELLGEEIEAFDYRSLLEHAKASYRQLVEGQ
ncbi:MAG TPA: sugar phosphate isomerase/epimerase [Planctomycetaceae bacterium]|nr:sugar phosphate isomerase/epimerase [Planctomycetaceae bacterium]